MLVFSQYVADIMEGILTSQGTALKSGFVKKTKQTKSHFLYIYYQNHDNLVTWQFHSQKYLCKLLVQCIDGWTVDTGHRRTQYHLQIIEKVIIPFFPY